jgi:hypothetical protein
MSTQLATTEAQQIPEFDAICMAIAELEQKLLEQDPEMPTYLQRIHMNLLKHPELVHILRDEQRAVIIDGLMQQTGVVLSAVDTSKAKSTVTKRLKTQSVDDI